VLRRSVLLLPAVLTALALPVAPALAGEDDGSTPPPTPPSAPAPVLNAGTAKLQSTHGCVSGKRAKAAVTGTSIAKVSFYVDGKRIKTVKTATGGGRYLFSMNCSHLSVGANTARAAVTFQAGTTPARVSLRFQITRSRQTSPRFTG
jgi:hypothetical protein